VRVAILIYVAGVVVGLIFTDARPLARAALALAWPIAPLAFVTVVTGLLLASLYIFPWFGALVAAAVAAGWLFVR
jgi:hypothetical protein